nr:reverse transcriptase [Tanacetum cinerariifolium]
MHELEDYSIFDSSNDDEDVGVDAGINNLDTTIQVSHIPTTRIHKDHHLDQVIEDLQSATQIRRMSKNLEEHGFVSTIQQRTNHKDLQNCLFACFLSQEEPKKIKEEVYVCQPPGFEDPDFPDRVYKVKKALYILHQAPRAWFTEVKTASTPMETQKPLLKDEDGEEVDVHMYSTQDALKIIENKSKVRTSQNKPVVAKVSTNTSTFGLSPNVVALTNAVKALLLKNTTPPPASIKAVEESCVTCGGPHPYYHCPTTNANALGYQDNIQAYVSAAAVNYNQGNSGYRPPSVAHQSRPPGFPPVQNNQNRGNNYNPGNSTYRAPTTNRSVK